MTIVGWNDPATHQNPAERTKPQTQTEPQTGRCDTAGMDEGAVINTGRGEVMKTRGDAHEWRIIGFMGD